MNNFAIASCVTTCIIIFTLFSIVQRYRRRRHLYKQASKFPGPPTLPIIGNAHLFTGTSEGRVVFDGLFFAFGFGQAESDRLEKIRNYSRSSLTFITVFDSYKNICKARDIFDRLIQLGKSYPAPYRFWIGPCLLLVINTPEQLKVVLHSPKTIDKGNLFDLGRPWLGTGLLTASDAKWRVHRKLIQPTFSTSILQSFVEIFSAQSAMMAKRMERNLDGPEFDISNYVTQWALHTTCETTMGVNLAAQTNDNESYSEIAEKAMASVCRRVVSPWLHPNCIFYRTLLGKNQQRYIKFLHDFTDNVIRVKRKELLEQSHRPGLDDKEEDTNNQSPRKKVFLDHLIEVSGDGETLSDEALREEVDTIMVTGSDTAAVTSSYVMLMLASHPEIQEKVYQEICEIYGDVDGEERPVTQEDLSRMTYLERVVKETLRLFPIVPFIIRTVTEDLDIGDHTFPVGSLILLSLIELHRHEDIWPDPMKFDPDRFLPEEVKKRDSYTYLPFSGGPRICIGSKYAMMSMKTLFATILRRYVLKKNHVIPAQDLRFKWEFVMRSADPITIRIERRSQKVACSVP